MYERKFDGNLGVESKEFNLSKPYLIQLNKILSRFNGGLNITEPTQPRDENQEYQDYIDFLGNNATIADTLNDILFKVFIKNLIISKIITSIKEYFSLNP